MKDSTFENWKHIALIAALHVQIVNKTDKPILVAGYAYTNGTDQGQLWDGQATREEIMSVTREINRRGGDAALRAAAS